MTITSSFNAIKNRYPSGITGIEQPSSNEKSFGSNMYGKASKVMAKNKSVA